jgi:hypothetical protein
MGWSAANKELEEPYKNRILQEIQLNKFSNG